MTVQNFPLASSVSFLRVSSRGPETVVDFEVVNVLGVVGNVKAFIVFGSVGN